MLAGIGTALQQSTGRDGNIKITDCHDFHTCLKEGVYLRAMGDLHTEHEGTRVNGIQWTTRIFRFLPNDEKAKDSENNIILLDDARDHEEDMGTLEKATSMIFTVGFLCIRIVPGSKPPLHQTLEAEFCSFVLAVANTQ